MELKAANTMATNTTATPPPAEQAQALPNLDHLLIVQGADNTAGVRVVRPEIRSDFFRRILRYL